MSYHDGKTWGGERENVENDMRYNSANSLLTHFHNFVFVASQQIQYLVSNRKNALVRSQAESN